jgi:hypothetical protein
MTVNKIELTHFGLTNETVFGLTNGILIGTPSAVLGQLANQYGGASLPVKFAVATPSALGEFVFSMRQEGGGYSISYGGITKFAATTAIASVVGEVVAGAAVALGVTGGVPVAVTVAVGTTLYMAITGDAINGGLEAAMNSIHSIIQYFNDGTLDDVLIKALQDAWAEVDFQANPVTEPIADAILAFLDGLLGSPEDPFPASNAITAMANALRLANATPICLDLTNNNLQYIPNTANSGVYFDIDADGFKEKTEWLAPDDGFLVRDLNNNGVIDSQTELFGDNGGTTAYAKLAALNTNNTGAITNDNYPCLTFPLTKIA